MLDAYKVFEHFDMLWMGIGTTLIVTSVQKVQFFWKIGVCTKTDDIVVSWLRLQEGLRLYHTSILDVYNVF
jgi:hypothetical protein